MIHFTDLWRHPTAEEIRQRDLEQAERDLLAYEKAEEQARAMVICLRERVKRLKRVK